MEQRPTATVERGAVEGLWGGYANWGFLAPALILFFLGGVTDILLPGVYMDAVNPDYLVVRLLNPGTNAPAWILPGTLLFGLFPVIGQIYHGALPFYVGLPIYAIFGTGVVGIRLANLLFGLIVLIAAGIFLRAFRVKPVIAGFCLAALALDPGFLFSFRTQFYITLLPCALLLSSIALVEHRRMFLTPGIMAAAGFLAGLAVYGYFIYAFLVPVAALHAWTRWRGGSGHGRLILWWVAGLALGGSPYLLGMFLILVATGGVHGFLSFLANNLSGLGVDNSPLSLAQRGTYFVDMVSWTLLGVGPSSMMLHKALPLAFPGVKTALLLVVPALGLLASLIRPPRSPGLLVVTGLLAAMAAMVGLFGSRLWLHHAAYLLPVMYIALALTLDQWVQRFTRRRGAAALVVAIILVLPLLAGNAVDRQAAFFELQRTGGVGLASDAIERFAEESLQTRVPTHAFFPDWGVFMPFEMITHGRIPLTTGFTPEDAVRTLCGGQDVLLALVDGQDPNRLPGWIDAVGWGQPDITIYRQRDGVPVLTAIRWRASASSHPVCP